MKSSAVSLGVLVLSLCALAAEAAGQGGVAVWNGNPAAPHLDITGDEGGAKLEPVRIVAARNGTFSGKVVVCSPGPIASVQAQMGPLTMAEGGGQIPADNVKVRLATGWVKSGWLVQPKAGSTFDILNEGALPEPVKPLAENRQDKYHPWLKAGRAYVPVWVTVTVPPDAPAGEYTARLIVRAGGATKAAAVSLEVLAYTLPDSKDWRTWIETIESPDTLATEYNVPLWSARHWELIAESLRFGAMLGNKTVYFPLIRETNFGNAESAVRWVKGADGKYTYDFSIVQKYLDLQTEVQGTPRIVCFPIWDTFLEGGQFGGDIQYESEETRSQRLAYRGKGPEVTLLDAATGKTSRLQLAQMSEPGSPELWSPLLKQIPNVLAERKLGDALFFGMSNDTVPHQSYLDVVNSNVPNAKWAIQAHSFYGGKDKKANFQYAAFVWGVKGFCNGAEGWKNPFLLTQFLRNMADHWPITTYRMAPEVNLTGGQRGLGRVGLDYWRVIKNSRGARAGQIWDRYPKSSWRNLDITDALLAPGKTGPLATARFEMLREGTQECEARIFIQTALDDGKLPQDVAARCAKVLSERDAFLKKAAIVAGNGRPWFASSNPPEEAYLGYALGWQEQSEKLYHAAAEVQAAQAATPPAGGAAEHAAARP